MDGEELLGPSVGVFEGEELLGDSVGVLDGEELLGDPVGVLDGDIVAEQTQLPLPNATVKTPTLQSLTQRKPGFERHWNELLR